jgi:hypothetical protein
MDKTRKPKDYYSDENGITAMFHPDWDSTFSYIVGDVVFRSGLVFACTQACKGLDPLSNPTYWTNATASAVYAS